MKKNISYMGLYLAVALVLSYIESIIPFQFPIPGMKLGLANLAIVLCMYTIGIKEAFTIDILRIVLTGFLFGSMYTILYSLAGGILSFCIMLLAKKISIFQVTGVSILGGVFHNIGQLIMAYIVICTKGILYYFPILLISGMVTGLLIGLVSLKLLPVVKKIVLKMG